MITSEKGYLCHELKNITIMTDSVNKIKLITNNVRFFHQDEKLIPIQTQTLISKI